MIPALLCLTAFSSFAQTPTYNTAPPASWSHPLDPEPALAEPVGQIEDGIDDILIDQQQNIPEQASFYHYTRHIINEQGIQNGSEFRIGFDPSYEKLTFHWLKVKRDGVWQDRLPTEKIQLLQRETNLESQMLDGRYTAVCDFHDIRAGDVIDYAYTIEGANPVFGGKFSDSFSTTFSREIHRFSAQVLTTKDRPLYCKSYVEPIEPVKTENPDGTIRYVWSKDHVPATTEEKDTPNWYDTFGWVQMSEYANWKEVVDWGVSIYPFSAPLSPELQEKIKAIAEKYPKDEDRVVAVMELVQKEVRYLGIEMGENSYQPTAPAAVYEHRFGDCKDKSFLCVALLRALGLNADPALVNTDYCQQISQQLPSPFDFDHAILRVIINNRAYWLDATRTSQSGQLHDFYIDDFKQALVLKPGNTSLEPMQISLESLPKEELQEVYTFSSVKGPIDFKVHTICQGEQAESTRDYFAQNSREKIEKNYLDYYANTFTKIKVAQPLRFQDFPDENRFEVWEDYQISDAWTQDNPKSPWKFTFYALATDDALGTAPSPQRKSPYYHNYPEEIDEKIEAHLWENWPITPQNNSTDSPNFSYSDYSRAEDNVLHFNYHYKSITPEVSVEQLVDYHDKIQTLKNNLNYYITYNPPPPPAIATPSDKPPADWKFTPQWRNIALSCLIAIGAIILAVILFFWPRPRPPHPLPPELASYQGIGGWLIIVILGLLFRLIFQLVQIGQSLTTNWNQDTWDVLTTPGTPAYNPLWAPILFFEDINIVIAEVLSLLALFLLFQKRALFPKLMIGLMVLSFVYTVSDNFLSSLLKSQISLPQNSFFDLNFFRNSVPLFIWVPYLIYSKRVRATFRF